MPSPRIEIKTIKDIPDNISALKNNADENTLDYETTDDEAMD